MLDAARSHERGRVDEYRKLLELVAGRSEGLEAFARAQIAAEERHLAELTSSEAHAGRTSKRTRSGDRYIVPLRFAVRVIT